jgi:Flp pilus assembly protein TadB
MTTIQLLACIGMITGFFLLIGLKPMEFTDGLFSFLTREKKSIKDEIKAAQRRQKPGFLKQQIHMAQEVLAMTGRSNRFSLICACSLLLFAIGAAIAIVMGNFFLAPVMAVGFMMLPFWYVQLTASHFKKDIAAELETALSIVTTAYLRSENILTAVEENLHYLNPPVHQVFKDFVLRVKLIDPDVLEAIKVLRTKIDNEVFREWCDALCDCQHDRSLKSTLTPIVSKLSDMRIVNGELEYLVFEPRKEFIIMVIFVIGNVPLMYLLNKSWYDTLMHTPLGQIILAISAALIFVSTACVIKLTKPIEYRR